MNVKILTNEDFCSFIILSSYLLDINLKKIIIMAGCGCKKNGNQTPQQQPQQQPTQQQPKQTNSIQESIRKVVEKYYKK